MFNNRGEGPYKGLLLAESIKTQFDTKIIRDLSLLSDLSSKGLLRDCETSNFTKVCLQL